MQIHSCVHLSPLPSVQIQRYNVLLKTICSSLADLEKGIKGLVVMSADLEEVFTCIYNAQVPALWSKVLHGRAMWDLDMQLTG